MVKCRHSIEEIEMLAESNYIEKEYGAPELFDAIVAWDFAKRELSGTLLRKSSRFYLYVLQIHKLLLQHRNPKIAGAFRRCDVYIGGERKKFISESLFIEAIDDIKNKILLKEDPKETHVFFEHLHPFEDGNGRVGRILYNIHRLYMEEPIHIIHEGKEQEAYYQWFR